MKPPYRRGDTGLLDMPGRDGVMVRPRSGPTHRCRLCRRVTDALRWGTWLSGDDAYMAGWRCINEDRCSRTEEEAAARDEAVREAVALSIKWAACLVCAVWTLGLLWAVWRLGARLWGGW